MDHSEEGAYHPLERIGKKKPHYLCVRGSVRSPILGGHDPIEVNIYGRTFFPLRGFSMGDERVLNINSR